MKTIKMTMVLVAIGVTLSAVAATVKVDAGRVVGPVKPVNGVGQPPMLGFGREGLFHYLTEAGIPFSRLHDVGGAFGNGSPKTQNFPRARFDLSVSFGMIHAVFFRGTMPLNERQGEEWRHQAYLRTLR